ncbi:MAG: cob(I)yrinic acid a,c-diamide adenosyltransferase [Gemmatimonadetes bacterium]|nr:cob(I)yrinic acid a,c-diamide adenosyltransferase [Gemmatimonadota bacterium]NNF12475.1 cob(I)yrinic acid a,c-diamide adenosyltransferase [Gemmatimonadota bacterium]NNL31517.1 cob(I)yrinic acid a,c-diamide adenosyltransferase [Gemmatimonadota bacterium]
MKIYTRTGDDGQTALFGGGRVPKDAVRVAAYGTVDELNAVLGWSLTVVVDAASRSRLESVQHDLFAIGSALATPPPAEGRRSPEIPAVPVERVDEMERWIDEADEELAPLRAFVLPGGSPGAAALHMARTVCRRAERDVVALAREEDVADGVTVYINRLSDLLFTLARLENLRAGREDVEWVKPGADGAP